jgi:Flp pilus assembly protein TadG
MMKFVKPVGCSAGASTRRGQVFLEFALVLPICLMMFAAMVDLGLYLHRYLSVQTAVREGIRAAASGSSDDQIRSIVLTASGTADLKPGEVQVIRRESDPALATLDPGDGQPMAITEGMKAYQTVEVRVLAHHTYMVPIFFQGRSWTHIAVAVKTVRAAR